MIRVLQITQGLHKNGTETFIMNVFRNLDRAKIMFDFLLYEHTDSGYEEEARNLGANLYYYPPRRKGLWQYYKGLDAFFKAHAHEYAAVHYNGCSFTELMPLRMAKKYGVPIRIAHCHSISTTGIHNKLLHLFNRTKLYKEATHYLACSEAAKRYGFLRSKVLDKALVLPNGIEIEQFTFNPTIRKAKRDQLGIGDEFVIGNVAGFRKAKNHEKMLEIMSSITQSLPNAKMLFIGNEGELGPKIRKMVSAFSLQDHVLFLGSRNDVPELLQAMDVFLFPSLYEGLGISVIEAQAAGLPVFASTAVPLETKVTPLIQYLPLSLPAEKWAEAIINSIGTEREQYFPSLKAYDIVTTNKMLTGIYLS